MNNIFISDQAQLLQRKEPGQVPGGTRAGESTSFADHIKRKVAEQRRRNLLERQEQQARRTEDMQRLAREKKAKQLRAQEMQAAAVATQLEGLLTRLRELAQDRANGAGQWTLRGVDSEQLGRLASEAGMSAAKIDNLLAMDTAQGGQLPLEDLLDTMTRHFNELGQGQPITTAETDLPLLETLLARMGIATEEISRVGEGAVTGDGRLDLVRFQEGLEELPNAGSTVLSDWEAEQLQTMLEKAGVSESLRQTLLWERSAAGQNGQWGSAPVVMGVGRLYHLLSQAIQDIQANRLQPDLPAFVADLESVLAQSGLEDRSVGWSPVVQNSIIGAYRELLHAVDVTTLDGELGGGTLPWSVAMSGGQEVGPGQAGQLGSAFDLQQVRAAIQQQIVEQLSRSMMHGLQRGEHHLVLKLQPPELGDVQIDLLVHDEQVSVSFSVDNGKVKPLLENSLAQFQQNLADKGFSLGGFSVAVNQQQTQDPGQDFQRTWQNMHGEHRQAAEIAAPLDEVAVQQRQMQHQGLISLLV